MTPPPRTPPQQEPSRESMREFAQALAEGLLPGLIQAVRDDSANLLKETREDAARHHHEVLAKFEERVEVLTPPPAAPAETTIPDDELQRARLVLTYNAWRTMLGRRGAAAVFLAERVDHDHKPSSDGGHIRIVQVPFPKVRADWTLVAIDSRGGELQAKMQETAEFPVVLAVEGLKPETRLARLEIRDKRGFPLCLGLGPAIGPPRPAPANDRKRSDG